MNSFIFFDLLFLRTPFYSYQNYASVRTADRVREPHFRVGLYLASSQLYEALRKKDFDFEALSGKEQTSIKKYVNRMVFRPTPFGGFSSFNPASWGETPGIILGKAHLHLNLDQEVVLKLADLLTQEQPEQQRYHCNPSLYSNGKEFRFLRGGYEGSGKKLIFELEAFEQNSLSILLLEFCKGAERTGDEIIAFVVAAASCTRESAREYFIFLVHARLLVSELAVNIVGQDYLTRLLRDTALHSSSLRSALDKLAGKLSGIKYPSIDDLDAVSHDLRALPGADFAKSGPHFYAGLERKVVRGDLSVTYREQVNDGIVALELLVPLATPTVLEKFKADFRARYDRRKVPLMIALDPESGIGYGQVPFLVTDLLHDVKFSAAHERPVDLEWSAVHRLLLKKWHSNADRAEPLVLTPTDLEQLPASLKKQPSSPSLAVIFRVLDEQVWIENAGGASAIPLIGRFTTWSDAVHQCALTVADTEKRRNPDVIFAEIGQLSDAHADNINRRRQVYDFEIPINTLSTLPPGNQLILSDLLLSVIGDELVLESVSLNKRVIPRLSSAYNYLHNHLSVFRLLCDLQYQGIRANFSFSLENYFPGLDFYPRVVYKNTILSPACWHLPVTILASLKPGEGTGADQQFQLIKKQLRLPRFIALVRQDQQLVFDTEVKADTDLLLDMLAGLKKAVLQEYIIADRQLVKDSSGGPLIHQFVAFLYNPNKIYHAFPEPETGVSSADRSVYVPGTRWLYLKIYCNALFANDLLNRKILPVITDTSRQGIRPWFFVRYTDQGFHIRLRLKINADHIGDVLLKLKKHLSGAVHYQLVRDYQADTYRREMERYGADIIHAVENFFYGSSTLTICYIKVASLKKFPFTYHSLAFITVNYLLAVFLPTVEERGIFLQQMAESFYAEFAADRSLKIELDKKFRELRTEIRIILSSNNYFDRIKLVEPYVIFKNMAIALRNSTGKFSARRRHQLLADMIHMHLNRLFIDRPRQQELIIYYCLHKDYQGLVAIAKKIS